MQKLKNNEDRPKFTGSYKACTETALLKVTNNILLNMNKRDITVLFVWT